MAKRATGAEGRGRSRQSYGPAGKAKWGYTDSTRNFGAQDFAGQSFSPEQQNQSRQTRPKLGRDHAPADIADTFCNATEAGSPTTFTRGRR